MVSNCADLTLSFSTLQSDRRSDPITIDYFLSM